MRTSRFERVRMGSALAAFAMLGWFMGCEHPPTTDLPRLNGSDDFVHHASDRASDWNYFNSEFLVERQSPFQFVRTADRDLIGQSLRRIDSMPKFVTEKQQQISDADYLWLRRFLEPAPELQWISIGGPKDDVSQDVFCMTSDGQRLITVGKQVTIWNCNTGTALSKFESTFPRATRVFLDCKEENLFLSNSDEVVKQNLKTAKITARWPSSKGQIVSLAKASDVDVMAIQTNAGDLVTLDSDLNAPSRLKLSRFFNPSISINATGKSVIASTAEGPLRWNIESPGQSPKISKVFDMPFDGAIACSGSRFERWISRNRVFMVVDGKAVSLIPYNSEQPILVGSIIRHAHAATVDGSQDWLVTIGLRRTETGKTVLQIQDWDLGEFVSSSPQVLDRTSIQSASFDRTGERIALKTERGLEIVSRRRWIDDDGVMTLNRIIGLFKSGELDRFEACASEIRKIGKRKFRSVGPEQWDSLAASVSMVWADRLAKNPSDELLPKIEAWAAKRSELARLSSVLCHNALLKFRKSPGNYGISQANYTLLLETIEQWKHETPEDFEQLLALSDPTPSCFALALATKEKNTKNFVRDCDQILKACVERWPQCTLPHSVMIGMMVRRDGPTSLDCFPYLKQLAKLRPEGSGEDGLAPSSTSQVRDEIWFLMSPGPFSVAQSSNLAEGLFSDQPITPWKFETWLFLGSKQYRQGNEIITGSGVENLMGRMIEYHCKHCELPTATFYRSVEAATLYSQLMDSIDR